ncbi:MAG TPA: hypothetical protein VNU46_01135 [Gemmatimonadaceae bacterium]|nr:hypothetical protein [Gemmatimonadaceae bacterium]
MTPRRTTLGRIGSLLTLVLIAPSLAAQLAPRAPQSVDSTRQGQQLATVTTDTGEWAPGHRDWTRYTDPLLCLEAARLTREVLRGGLAVRAGYDTLQYMPEQDTLPAAVAVTARACGTRFFKIAGTAESSLPVLFELALLARNDSLAHAVVARRIALTRTDTARWQVMLWAIGGYVGAEPARVLAAEALVAQLDQRDSAALLARQSAHVMMKGLGLMMYDPARIRREDDSVIALSSRMKTKELIGDTIGVGAKALVDSWVHEFGLAYIWYPDSLPMLAQRLQEVYRTPEIQRYLICVANKICPAIWPNGYNIPPDVIFWPVHQVISKFEPWEVSDLGSWNARSGSPDTGNLTRRRLPAVYWFPATDGDSVQPEPGKVTLIIDDLTWNCLNSEEQNVWINDCDRDKIARMRSFLWHYGKAGLTVTVVKAIHADSMNVRLHTPMPSDTVARIYGWFVRDVLHLPVSLAVDTVSKMLQLPAPDGRMWYRYEQAGGSVWDDGFSSRNAFGSAEGLVWRGAMLFDRDGRLLWKSTEWTEDNSLWGMYGMLDMLLVRELKGVVHSTEAAPTSDTTSRAAMLPNIPPSTAPLGRRQPQ